MEATFGKVHSQIIVLARFRFDWCWSFSATILIILLTGYASAQEIRAASSPITVTNSVANEFGKSLPTVFGRIIAKRDGDTQKLGTMGWFGGYSCNALVLFETDNRGLVLPFDQDGWFEWKLDAGDYVLSDFYCPWNGKIYTLPVMTQFKVDPQAGTMYIGHFNLIDNKGRFEPVSWAMQESEATTEFARRHPGGANVIPEAPVRVSQLGNFKMMHSICSSEWGTECTRSVQGLELVEPAVDRELNGLGFTDVSNLTPTLKWKPPSRSGLTYDVVVWEATAYRLPSALKDIYEPGRPVVYAENLDSPIYVVQDSLKPKTRYFWSVRLRDHDLVSSWSVGGHLTILLFYNSSSSGQLYRFETP